MGKPIRVLGIAPYEGMKGLMESLAEEYPQMDLTLFVGDLEKGVEIAKSNFHGNYDVVISRGGTARMLRQQLALPVIEIEISTFDILCALKLADGISGKVAVVSYAETSSSAKMLCDLLGYDMDVFTLDTRDSVESTLRQLRGSYSVILCDVIANTTAQMLGLDSLLITSGSDSVRQAFQRAMQFCHSQERLRNENLFFRQLLSGQISDTVVFDEDGTLFLSTLQDTSADLMELLRQELPESKQETSRRITRMIGGSFYSIRAQRIASGDLDYIAFFFTSRKSPLPAKQTGIRFFSCAEAESAFYESVFSYAGVIMDYQEQIARISRSRSSVIITGEDGTGKETVAQILYMRGPLKSNTLVCVDCSELTEKSWDFLLEHPDSPLSDEGTTIYFSNIDVLSMGQSRRLLAVLDGMNVCRRNRVIFSCVCQPGENMSAIGALFADELCCLSFSLTPLRKNAERIPTLVNLTLSHLNASTPGQIAGVGPEAMELLQRFPWPHNYMQFRRVIGELAAASTGPLITLSQVTQALRKERHVGAFTSTAENVSAPLALSRTLTEISRDIASRVVEEKKGSQTAAAKSLGISRTTLWRLLKGN